MSSIPVDDGAPTGKTAHTGGPQTDRIAIAIRASVRLGTVLLISFVACLILSQVVPADEKIDYWPPQSELARAVLGSAWLACFALALYHLCAGRMPGALWLTLAIPVLTIGRLSTLRWQTGAQCILAFVILCAFKKAQSPLAEHLPQPLRKAMGAAVWLVMFGISLTTPTDSSAAFKQLAAFALSGLFFLPVATAAITSLVIKTDEIVKRGWKLENLLWAISIGLLVVNIMWKRTSGSSVHQIYLGGVSIELFEWSRVLAVSAFAIASHRWSELHGKRRGWTPPLSVLIMAAITASLYFALKEKGTLAPVVASFIIIWTMQVGGRSTLVMALSGVVVLLLAVAMASDRLRMAAGEMNNAQAEAFALLSSHLGLIGAGGAARPGIFLNAASSSDFMLAVAASQGGLVGMALVLGATVVLFASLFRGLWHLRVGMARALGITGFIHLLLPVVICLLSYATGLVVGIPYPLLGRGGNHLLVSMAWLGVLLSIAAKNPKSEYKQRGNGLVRMRAVLTLCLFLFLFVCFLALKRVGSGFGEDLSPTDQAGLLQVPMSIPAMHNDIIASDGHVLARTTRGADGFQRSYDVDQGFAPVLGAGTGSVHNSGVQGRIFSLQNGSGVEDRVWLFGPREFSIKSSEARLTINSDWSKKIYQAVATPGFSGVVLVASHEGAVRASLSLPGFDPNRTGDDDYLKSLYGDPQAPMFNRVVLGKYYLASTFKPVEGCVLVELGLGDFVADCDGSRCSGMAHQKVQGIEEAIRMSCNYWFQSQATRLEQSRWKQRMEATGLGRLEIPVIGTCGAPLPTAPGGVRRDWAIGQGWTASPLNLLAAYLTILNDGLTVRPYVVDSVGAESLHPVSPGESVLSPAACQRVRGGMRRAVLAGTARTIMQTYTGNQTVVAKTGTAEIGEERRTNALMVAMTRTHVVVVIRERGGKGATLGPAVGRILNIIEGR